MRSALISIIQALYYYKTGIDIISRTPVSVVLVHSLPVVMLILAKVIAAFLGKHPTLE